MRKSGRALLLTVSLAVPLVACGLTGKTTTAGPAPGSAAPSPTASASRTASPTAAPSGTAPGAFGVRAAHITSFGWAEPTLRDPILELVKEKKLDAVQLDIKDEDGIVGYDSQVPLAVAAGTVMKRFDIKEAVSTIHAAGAKVIGRIVTFRDPRLARWAVKNQKMDYVIQNTSGGAYNAGTYGTAAFTNFANPDVIEYNVALAEEAAKAGFDGIMYDYVRKPENTGQVYPGIGSQTPVQAITAFVRTAAGRIHAAGATAGAAVFGISAFAPTLVAQDIPQLAKYLDFVSPMIYPSHWNSGEYSVSSPVHQPYDIVKRSLMDFNRLVIGTNCRIQPWLQNFSWPILYSSDDVAAQIRAAKDDGINSFFLWNDSSKVGLGAPALVARDASSDAPGQVVYSVGKPGNASDGTTEEAKAKEFIDAWLAWVDAGKQGTFVDPLGSGGTPTPTSGP
ncbi:MAG TPA: putative glycoside hydrolase [Sporichthyaceae bacterium]|nr:putative glycoside hydrolase [Sporichthyaceae bacterium]